MTDIIGAYGSGEYGTGPYGSAYPPFGIESVTPLTSTLVRVRYTAMFDPAFIPLLAASNYDIFPVLSIYAVILESAQSVLLVTSAQSEVVYTLTVSEAKGYFGQPLDPNLNQKTFLGVPASPTFFAVATRKTRVRAVFSTAMSQNPALTDPLQYSVTDLNGASVPILSVTAEQSTSPVSIVLTLSADLVDERWYKLTVLSGVVTADGHPLNPSTSVFQWVENPLHTSIPISRFSGEVQNGLYGIHNGLVFFSPALVNSAANSIIQVEEVSVCTKAFDEYHYPVVTDPPVLFTHGCGVTPTPNVTTLNSTASLWAKFPRLMEATITLENHLSDVVPSADDPVCEITLSEQWDPAYVSLTNNPYWKIFDNAGTPPQYFITANNLAPIPPGSTQHTIVKLGFVGESSVGAAATVS